MPVIGSNLGMFDERGSSKVPRLQLQMFEKLEGTNQTLESNLPVSIFSSQIVSYVLQYSAPGACSSLSACLQCSPSIDT